MGSGLRKEAFGKKNRVNGQNDDGVAGFLRGSGGFDRDFVFRIK